MKISFSSLKSSCSMHEKFCLSTLTQGCPTVAMSHRRATELSKLATRKNRHHCLTPAGCKWWRKKEYPAKTTAQPQVTKNILTRIGFRLPLKQEGTYSLACVQICYDIRTSNSKLRKSIQKR